MNDFLLRMQIRGDNIKARAGKTIRRFVKDKSGVTIMEYVLLISIIVIVGSVILLLFKDTFLDIAYAVIDKLRGIFGLEPIQRES